MNPIINSIIWSILPISEIRGGLPVAIASGLNPYFAFVICVIANCLAIPITFFFLDYLHRFFLRFDFYRNMFEKHLEKAQKKIESSIGTMGEFIALMLFVGVPLPMTGAYTGALLAWFFRMNRKKAYLSISLGVLIAGIIVSLVLFFGIKAFSLFIK